MYLSATSHCDRILDTSLLFNIIPERFQGREVNDDLLFDIARGNKEHVASALIKWFNTNYHYIVPEWDNVEPKRNHNVLLDRFNYAKSLTLMHTCDCRTYYFCETV